MSLQLIAIFVLCAMGVATPLPIPTTSSPTPSTMSPVNATVLQCVLNAQSTTQSSLLWANYLVRTYGAVLVPQPSCFEQQRSPTDAPDATIINYLPRLQEDLSSAIFNQYYLSGVWANFTLSPNVTQELSYAVYLSNTVRNLNDTITTLTNLINMLEPFVPSTPLVVIKGTPPPTFNTSSVASAPRGQNCYSTSYNQQYISAVRLQGVMQNYLYQDLLKVKSAINRIQ